MSSNKGKTVVITGATKGIGKAIAYKFASEGVNVAFTYNSNVDAANEIAADLESKYGVKAKAYPLNILELDEFKPLFLEIDKDFDRVDFFVSNAMIYGRSVVGGYGKFMKLRPTKGLQNIFSLARDSPSNTGTSTILPAAAKSLSVWPQIDRTYW